MQCIKLKIALIINIFFSLTSKIFSKLLGIANLQKSSSNSSLDETRSNEENIYIKVCIIDIKVCEVEISLKLINIQISPPLMFTN